MRAELVWACDDVRGGSQVGDGLPSSAGLSGLQFNATPGAYHMPGSVPEALSPVYSCLGKQR